MTTRVAHFARIAFPGLWLFIAGSNAVAQIDRARDLAIELASSVDTDGRQDTERTARQWLPLVQQLWRSNSQAVFELISDLSKEADHSAELARYADARKQHIAASALDISRAYIPSHRDNDLNVADARQLLGELCRRIGRYGDAQDYLEDAVNTRRKLASNAPHTALGQLSLAEVYRWQGRPAEAGTLCRDALRIAAGCGEPDRSYLRWSAHNTRGLCYYDLALSKGDNAQENEWTLAKTEYEQALAIIARDPSLDVGTFECLSNLGLLYHRWSRRVQGNQDWRRQLVRDAEKCFEDALSTLREEQRTPSDIIETYNQLADLHFDARDLNADDNNVPHLQAAQDHIQQAFKRLAAAPQVRLEVGYNSHYVRAKITWAKGQQGPALDDLREAMRLALEQRSFGAGTAYDVAGYFMQLTGAFERMVEWQTELTQKQAGDVQEAYSAVEQSRAQALLDQMQLLRLDLLSRLPEDQAREFREKLNNGRSEVAKLERKSRGAENADGNVRGAAKPNVPQQDLSQQLEQARNRLMETERAIWNIAPVRWELARNPRVQLAALDDLQRWAATQESLVLEYVLGTDGGYVLVIPAAGRQPWLRRLAVSEEQARTLGVDAGPLTADRMRAVLMKDGDSGVVDRLADRTKPVPLDALLALWQVLIPEELRNDLVNPGAVKRLAIIPDGPLALLPFEALVVHSGPQPEYLLDRSVPVLYAPSASILMDLAARPDPTADVSVLTMAKKDYGDHRKNGAKLDDLTNAIVESKWAKDCFAKAGFTVRQFTEREATESKFCAEAPNCQILLLACHGEAEEDKHGHGNQLGLLRLTIANKGPNDDGLLWLQDVYQLKLSQCELALLSACHTSYGPNQRSEGVWSLSRGFLVAGARRVVASQWWVSDEAAPRLVYYFCHYLSSAMKDKHPIDHAKALRDAKREVRKQANWQHPFFWAPFSLMGPH